MRTSREARAKRAAKEAETSKGGRGRKRKRPSGEGTMVRKAKKSRKVGVADEARSDAMPEAAGGEGGHGAAKLDPVIHRLRYLPYIAVAESKLRPQPISRAWSCLS